MLSWYEVRFYNKSYDEFPVQTLIIEAFDDKEANNKAGKLCYDWNPNGFFEWDLIPD